MPTVAQLLRAPGLDAADARALARHALGWTDAQLAARASDAVPPGSVAAFEALAARRAAGEPVAYLTGMREFYSLALRVTPAVLIPRPETELLVELALARLAGIARPRVLDLGTGSGCVALAIAHERRDAHVVATDRSPEALAVARDNAHRLGVQNVEYREGDWFAAVAGERYDAIVSNPPYVAEADPHLARGDLRYEPRAALASGPDGLDAIRIIVRGAPRHLDAGGWLMIEHGYDQAATCRALFAAAGCVNISSHRDIAGIERVTLGQAG